MSELSRWSTENRQSDELQENQIISCQRKINTRGWHDIIGWILLRYAWFKSVIPGNCLIRGLCKAGTHMPITISTVISWWALARSNVIISPSVRPHGVSGRQNHYDNYQAWYQSYFRFIFLLPRFCEFSDILFTNRSVWRVCKEINVLYMGNKTLNNQWFTLTDIWTSIKRQRYHWASCVNKNIRNHQ